MDERMTEGNKVFLLKTTDCCDSMIVLLVRWAIWHSILWRIPFLDAGTCIRRAVFSCPVAPSRSYPHDDMFLPTSMTPISIIVVALYVMHICTYGMVATRFD
jgi:hypothetical protein